MRWSLRRLAGQPLLQHARIRATAALILAVRWLEGVATWLVLYLYYAPHTVAPAVVHLSLLAYGVANLLLYVPHRRQGLTAALVWVDLLANLLPIAIAAHWSGGIYSPLLPLFVVKISSYGLIYSAEVGFLSFLTTACFALALAAIDALGWAPTPSVDMVPILARMRITLAFEVLTFGIMIGGSLRFFALLQQRDARLDQLVREKDRLYQDSLRHQGALRELSRNMMQSSEATMRHLVRELHDDLGQALTAVRMDLGMIDRDLPHSSPLHSRVHEAREQISSVLQSVRNLSQLLRPPVLDDLGLAPAMQWYGERFRERTGIDLSLDLDADAVRLPGEIEVALYRVFQEALTNVARHAGARRVVVGLRTESAVAFLTIVDDGCGFDVARSRLHPPTDGGTGLIGMRERVATYDGSFEIESTPGGGTSLKLAIPLTPAAT